jgi:hypothetical protein
MSLDIRLIIEGTHIKKSTGIFVREDGKQKELSYEEACLKFPDYDVNLYEEETNVVFHGNITHNLNRMAKFLGVYEVLWRPDEIGIFYANEVINPLREAIHKMKLTPDEYKKYNPANGWGSYEQLLELMEKYLEVCYIFPQSKIEISR